MTHLTPLSIENFFQLDIYGAYKTLIGVIFTTFSLDYDVIKSTQMVSYLHYITARTTVSARVSVVRMFNRK